jgi:DNA-binding Lrp family transcriptional regulator
LVTLENKIDGLSDEFRTLLKDRKRSYEVSFKGKGKLLDSPTLTIAIITERKRLEKEEAFLEDLRKSPLLAKQLEKKLASNLLALETTNIVISFVEFLDEYNRGEKQIPGAKDPEVMKVLAGTLTALSYSKSTKEKMALADPSIVQLVPSDSQRTLRMVDSGLGKMSEDTLFFIPEGISKKDQNRLEYQRLKKTKKLVEMVEQLATVISVANKSLSDEYQYHVLVLNQKMKQEREVTSKTKP